MKSMYQWLGKHVHAWYGTALLALFVVIEGFFFVPVSTLLAFYCLEDRKNALYYALVATIMSGFGAVVGYTLGSLLWQAGGKELIHYFVAADKFEQLVAQFKEYEAWTTFFVALTPVPFKLLTLTAGFIKLPLTRFIALSMAARGIRFFAIAIAISLWGESVQYYLDKYFYYVVAAGLALFLVLWFLVH